MRELLRLTVGSCAALAAFGLIHEPTAAAQSVTCESLPDPIYISGSSAIRPLLTTIGAKLAALSTPSTVVYISTGSCDGVKAMAAPASDDLVSAGAKYAQTNGTLADCTLPAAGKLMDLAMSDVFPTSCPEVTADLLDGVGDFAGPIQSMNFVVPKASVRNTISAEAAYLTFGLGAAGKTPWDNESLYFVRDFQSGTQTMLATAINVKATRWIGVKSTSGSTGVINSVAGATNPDKTIGVLASTEADVPANRLTIKRLAFQPYGETCALYPDSSFASLDKFNVRNGLYQVWGPVHMLAKVNSSGEATNPKAKQLLDILLGNTVVEGVDPVQAAIDNNTVPQCAMNVTRTEELGTPKAYSPVGACDCYFESKTGGASASCKTCDTSDDCKSGANKVCNRGYCEAK